MGLTCFGVVVRMRGCAEHLELAFRVDHDLLDLAVALLEQAAERLGLPAAGGRLHEEAGVDQDGEVTADAGAQVERGHAASVGEANCTPHRTHVSSKGTVPR